ncbi:MAG: tripartite tricarboxylate transporter TctB family protein [Pseudomonadota bacterium]
MPEHTKKISRFFDGDVLFLLICLVFSAAMLIATRDLHDVTATLVPRLFGTLAVFFALVALAFRAASFFWGFETKRKILGGNAGPRDGEDVEIEGAMNLYVAIALALAYVILTELIGFIVSTVVIVFAYLWFARFRRVVFGLIYAVLVAAALYWLFYTLLKVNLPAGFIPWPWQSWIQ